MGKFLFGAATSAHQVEGSNRNDWSEWEKSNADRIVKEASAKNWPDFILNPPAGGPSPLQKENYLSGKACEHYSRFKEDFDVAKKLGHNAHRFSIEWSRIEPEEGKFDEKEIGHYKEVVKALRERGLEPFVTLWHWTLPVWLAKKGGLHNKKFPEYFSRFSSCIVRALKNDVKFWLTMNEPTAIVYNSYYVGKWPPQKANFFSAIRSFIQLTRAHKNAYKAIHEIDGDAQAGFGNLLLHIETSSKNPFDMLTAFYREFRSNFFFLWLVGKKYNDFLTIHYYFHFKMQFPSKEIMDGRNAVSDVGWEIYPEGIYHLLKKLSNYKKPIYITENGVADGRDILRANFIKDHLLWIKKALGEGIDVRGYFYWSLLDNFEWDKGFWPRFGLIEVNYKTMERKIRPSAWEYKKLIETWPNI